MIDSHTHLDHGPAPDAELVAAAREAGVQPHPHDRHGRRLAAARALAAAEALRRGLRRGRPPPEPARPASTTPTAAELRELAPHPRCRAIGETGLDYYRDCAPRADQERAFLAQIELARETGKPLVIHTRAAEDDTIATLADARRRASR